MTKTFFPFHPVERRPSLDSDVALVVAGVVVVIAIAVVVAEAVGAS